MKKISRQLNKNNSDLYDIKKLLVAIMAALCILNVVPVSAKEYDTSSIINKTTDFFKTKYNTSSLLEAMSCDAMTPIADWEAFISGVTGSIDGREKYLSALSDKISELYKTDSLLDRNRATEWHRAIFTIKALGGDPYLFSQDKNGNPINLVADGIYDRGKTASLGKQGLLGWIYGLLTASSIDAVFPDGAYYSYDDIITEIVSKQLADGGFALSGMAADSDVTAMAVQAVSLYESRQELKNYTSVVDNAVECLSEIQNPDGSYSTYGTENAESTAQVIIALCMAGINPSVDERFIKNGNSPLDALTAYQNADGGFSHIRGGESDGLATIQSVLALISYDNFINGKSSIYDLQDKDITESSTLQDNTLNGSQIQESSADNPIDGIITFAVIIVITATAAAVLFAVIIISNRKKSEILRQKGVRK